MAEPLVRPGDLFVDFFCGLGGASEGARAAGLRVALGVDHDPELLALHARNHPGAHHQCRALPAKRLRLAPHAPAFWLHGSPPCTALSRANQLRVADDRAAGLELVRWFLTFAMDSAAAAWSMEYVDCMAVKQLLGELGARGSPYRGRFGYLVLDLCHLGVPQNRRRILVGSPAALRALRRVQKRHRSVQDVIADPEGSHLRNKVINAVWRNSRGLSSRRLSPDDRCRPLSVPSYTVTAGSNLVWARPHTGTKLRSISVRHAQLLQTFPPTYDAGRCVRRARLGIGNAVPPLAMETWIRAAMGGAEIGNKALRAPG